MAGNLPSHYPENEAPWCYRFNGKPLECEGYMLYNVTEGWTTSGVNGKPAAQVWNTGVVGDIGDRFRRCLYGLVEPNKCSASDVVEFCHTQPSTPPPSPSSPPKPPIPPPSPPPMPPPRPPPSPPPPQPPPFPPPSPPPDPPAPPFPPPEPPEPPEPPKPPISPPPEPPTPPPPSPPEPSPPPPAPPPPPAQPNCPWTAGATELAAKDGTTDIEREDRCTYWSDYRTNETRSKGNSISKRKRKLDCKSTYTKDEFGRYYRCIFPHNKCLDPRHPTVCEAIPPMAPSPMPPPFPPPPSPPPVVPPSPPSAPWSCLAVSIENYESLRDRATPVWCNVYDKNEAKCNRSIIFQNASLHPELDQYNGGPNYRMCEYNTRTDKCTMSNYLRACNTPPPSAPSPPTPPPCEFFADGAYPAPTRPNNDPMFWNLALPQLVTDKKLKGSTCETAFFNYSSKDDSTNAARYQAGTDQLALNNYDNIHQAHVDCDRSYMQNEDFTWSWCEHKLTKDGGPYACSRKPEKMVCSSFPPSKPPPSPPPSSPPTIPPSPSSPPLMPDDVPQAPPSPSPPPFPPPPSKPPPSPLSPPPSPPPTPPPSMPWTCPNAVAEGRSENLHYRNIPDAQTAWCSIYSGRGKKDMCKRSFVQYNTTPPTYQVCKWTGGDTQSCSLNSKLTVCTHEPPATPPPPSSPAPPLEPPPPSPPTLCDAVGHEKISIRDLPKPKWCEAFSSDHDACEKAYVRFGPTYSSCVYSAVDAQNTYDPTCTMSETKLPCALSPPSAPSPPSTPYTCVNAGLIGLTQDLRYTPEKLGLSDHSTREWNLKHHVTSKTHPAGHTEYPVCDMYAQDKDECKRSYQTDGDVYYPCLFRNATGAASCKASPTPRPCS